MLEYKRDPEKLMNLYHKLETQKAEKRRRRKLSMLKRLNKEKNSSKSPRALQGVGGDNEDDDDEKDDDDDNNDQVPEMVSCATDRNSNYPTHPRALLHVESCHDARQNAKSFVSPSHIDERA